MPDTPALLPPGWQQLLEQDEEPCVDWKATAGEALYALRDGLLAWYPALADPLLDSVAGDLGDANAETWVPRLGQACADVGLQLCLLERDDDAYRLLVVLPEQLEPLVALVDAHGLEMELVQTPLQTGTSHAIAPPGVSLPCARVDFEANADWLPSAFPLVNARCISHYARQWLDLTQWPPRIGPDTRAASEVRWSASGQVCVGDVSPTDTGTASGRLHYALQPVGLAPQWHPLPTPLSRKGRPERICVHGFIGEDLFLLGIVNAWRITGLGLGAGGHCNVITPPGRDRGGCALLQLASGRGLIVLGGRFHTWGPAGLQPTGPTITAEGHDTIPWVDLQDGRIAWVQPWQEQILCVDIATGASHRLDVPGLSYRAALRVCAGGWFALTDDGRVTGATGVMRFWHPRLNLWRRMPRASLGGRGADWAAVTPAGDLLVGNHDGIWNLGAFVALIERMDPIRLG